MERKTYKELKRQRIISAEDYPFPVSVDATELGQNYTLARKVANEYPRIHFGQAVLIDGNVIINDIQTSLVDPRLLNQCSSRTIHIIEASTANARLNNLISNTDVTRLYVQGTGEDLMRLNKDQNTNNLIQIKKAITSNAPVIQEVILPIIDDLSKEVIVFDDVVASGWTATKIATEIRMRYPNIKLSFATWIMLVRSDIDSQSGLRGYDSAYATYVAQGNLMLRPPINSLSCLIGDDTKSTTVQSDYARKYITNTNDFQLILRQLKGGENT